MLPTTRQVWRQPAQRFARIQTKVGQPEFFDPAEEAAYYAAGLDEDDRVGQTFTNQFTDVADPIIETNWPTSRNELVQAMERFIDNTGSGPSDAPELFILASNILRETNPSPELRGAIVDVLRGLPLELVRSSTNSITVSLQDGDQELTMTLSYRGDLLEETTTLQSGDRALGLPVDTVLTAVRYQPGHTVSDLP